MKKSRQLGRKNRAASSSTAGSGSANRSVQLVQNCDRCICVMSSLVRESGATKKQDQSIIRVPTKSSDSREYLQEHSELCILSKIQSTKKRVARVGLARRSPRDTVLCVCFRHREVRSQRDRMAAVAVGSFVRVVVGWFVRKAGFQGFQRPAWPRFADRIMRNVGGSCEKLPVGARGHRPMSLKSRRSFRKTDQDAVRLSGLPCLMSRRSGRPARLGILSRAGCRLRAISGVHGGP